MAKIHQSIQGVLEFFEKYKGEDGVLDKKEFRAIIEKECKVHWRQRSKYIPIFPPFFFFLKRLICAPQGNVDESVLEKLFQKLDQNKDGKLDMEEYSNVICLMIRTSYYKRMRGGLGGGCCTGKGSCK